uniref:Putative secreted protein n=1 Tax=Ixodes ricinus TaxID=34613 RepID=A0A6B0TVT2_IXORI
MGGEGMNIFVPYPVRRYASVKSFLIFFFGFLEFVFTLFVPRPTLDYCPSTTIGIHVTTHIEICVRTDNIIFGNVISHPS